RPQGNQGQQFHAGPGLESEPPVLRDCGNQQRRLHACEGLADADPRTATEWKERELRALLLLLGEPALGPERPRVGIAPRIVMHRPLTERDVRTCWNPPASQLDVTQRAPPDCPYRRVHAQGFVEHPPPVGVPPQGIPGRAPPPPHPPPPRVQERLRLPPLPPAGGRPA